MKPSKLSQFKLQYEQNDSLAIVELFKKLRKQHKIKK